MTTIGFFYCSIESRNRPKKLLLVSFREECTDCYYINKNYLQRELSEFIESNIQTFTEFCWFVLFLVS